MPEQIQNILNRIKEWWNKFTTKQKTYIIAAAAGVILTVAILVTVLTRPQYTYLYTAETAAEGAEVRDILDGESLDYKVSNDGLIFQINKTQQAQANFALGSNNIQAAAYTIDNVIEGGFSTTEADKQKKYQVYMEKQLGADFMSKFAFVKSAVVKLYMPDNDGTLIKADEESSAWVLLELDGSTEVTQDMAAGMAHATAVAIGNKTDANIVIMDTEGNTLFSGAENLSSSGLASSQMSVKSQWETNIKNAVRQVVVGTGEFDKVEVAVNLNVDFSEYTETDHKYYVEGDQSQGYLSNERTYNSEAVNGNAEVPGTDSNGEVEYEWQDNDYSSSSVEEQERNYLPNEKITNKKTGSGAIVYQDSSISLALTNINVVREETVKAQGLLDGITWEEYKLANDQREPIEVDQRFYDMVAKATGFPEGNISIVAYSENMFLDREGLGISATDVMTVLLIIVILGLLLYVILRSMKTEKEEEQPEELTVETLLQSTPEAELEDISTEQISETRRMIEKFIEDNPEAAANLLRNWLAEEWG
ncbi:MAG: flagellar M-ring protein FliF [Lachnospiraceae bacterium]|nr:flagellar M-ring protein FliF [Lachnospiraceae bacterium]